MIEKLFAPHKGGIEIHVAGLSKYLTKRGHQVEVLTSRFSKKLPSGSHVDGYAVTRVRGIHAMLRALQADVDIIHVHDYASAFSVAGAIARLIRPRPLVWTPHGIYPLRSGWARLRRIVFDCSVGRLLPMASDIVIALTKTNRAQLEEMGVDASRITVIPNGIDLQRLNLPKRRSLREQLGLVGQVLLHVGRLDWNKGLAYTVDALKMVTNHWPECKLLLIGKDYGIGDKLQSRAARLGISSNLLLLGEVADEVVAQAFVESDLFVISSIYEGLPTVVLEAMASGLPVIATRTGAPDVIRNLENGLLVDYGDAEGLASAIVALLENSELRTRLAAAGQVTIESFDWESVAKSVEEVYLRALERFGAL